MKNKFLFSIALICLATSTISSAKEISKEAIITPEVIQEVPLEPGPVIIPTTPAFVPNGTLSFTQTFYGNSGKYKTATAHPNATFNYNFAPKWSINLEWDRSFNMYDYNGGENQYNSAYSGPQINLAYDHGYVGNSKVKWSSTINIKNSTTLSAPTSDNTYVWGTTSFDFAEYLPSSEYAKPTQFAIQPYYIYGWNTGSGSGHENVLGISLLSDYQLPAGFSFQFNAYLMKSWYNGSAELSTEAGKIYNEDVLGAIYTYLNYSKDIYQFNKDTTLTFNFIGGLDPYMFSDKKVSNLFPFYFIDQQYEWMGPTVYSGNYKNTFIAFALPQLMLTHNITEDLSASLFVQAKYSNQVFGDTEKDWKIQPQGGFEISYKF